MTLHNAKQLNFNATDNLSMFFVLTLTLKNL